MSMSLILTIPCKTLMMIRETKVKSWLHHITKNNLSWQQQGLNFILYVLHWNMASSVNQLFYFWELRSK